MISSESSDEELEALHLPAAAPPTRDRNAKAKAKAKAKREREREHEAAVVPVKHKEEAAGSKKEEEATEVEEEEARRIKRELRKKRKLEERQRRADDKLAAERHARESERAACGRAYTVSMAIPGSILDNAQTKELKTYVAGQIARAAAIFQVDEVVVFDDQLGASDGNATSRGGRGRGSDCHVFMARVLQYLETPQYLRRALFPMHSDLSCAGLLNPLDCPHHLRSHEWSAYREGVVVDRPLKDKEGSHVHVGLQREVVVDRRLSPGVRVTVKIDEASKDFKKKLVGTLVSPAEPREQTGVYWGYTARMAPSLRSVWEDCPFPGGYDLKVGTSERGSVSTDAADFSLPPFRHALVVFGGVAGLEACVDADESIPASGEDARALFDLWVNTCPAQGSRTIRSEEAVLISLGALRRHLSASGTS